MIEEFINLGFRSNKNRRNKKLFNRRNKKQSFNKSKRHVKMFV